MALHLVTGYAGKSHITSADQGAFNSAIFGRENYVLNVGNCFSANAVTSNLVEVHDGEVIMQGRHIRLEPGDFAEVTIENGTQNYKRNDLICIRYTKDSETGVESASFVVIKGTPDASAAVEPAHIEGNILDGILIVDLPLYRVPLDGLNIEEPVALFEVKESIDARTSALETGKVDKVAGKGLSTNDYSKAEKEQVAANKKSIANIISGEETAGNSLKLNGLTSQQIGESGAKNLIPYPYAETTLTRNGITFTDNGDGTITFNGTTTSTAWFNLNNNATAILLRKGTYTLSGATEDSKWTNYTIRVYKTGESSPLAHTTGKSVTFTLDEDVSVWAQIGILSGVTSENLTFSPMLELGSVAHDYVPYHFGGAEDALTLNGLTAEEFVLLETAKASGLFDKQLLSVSIGDDFTAQDLFAKTRVTFFTNWTDSTNFPVKYGSGVMIPAKDSSDSFILYVKGTQYFVGHLERTKNDDGTYTWTPTWSEKANALDLASYVPITKAYPIYTGDILAITENGTYCCDKSNCTNFPPQISSWAFITKFGFRDAGYKKFIAFRLNSQNSANLSDIFVASESLKDSSGNLIWKSVTEDYLPLDGSVPMSGQNLLIGAGYGRFHGDVNCTTVGALSTAGNTNNMRSIEIYNANFQGDIADAFRLKDTVDGVMSYYTVLHTGNSAKVVVSETPLTAEGSVRVW